MTTIKIRYELLGGHVHVDVFERSPPGETWQCNGHLIFGEEGFARFARYFGETPQTQHGRMQEFEKGAGMT